MAPVSYQNCSFISQNGKVSFSKLKIKMLSFVHIEVDREKTTTKKIQIYKVLTRTAGLCL